MNHKNNKWAGNVCLPIVILLVVVLTLAGCGTGNSPKPDSKTSTPPTATPPPANDTRGLVVSPSKIMLGGGIDDLTIKVFINTNTRNQLLFPLDSAIKINGVPVETGFFDDYTLEFSIHEIDWTIPGVYTVEVVSANATFNAATLEVYSPAQGPQPFDAVPSYFLKNHAYPIHIEVNDLNGDAIKDVIVLGFNPNSYSLFILKGRRDGTLDPPQIIELDGMMDNMVCGDINGDGYTDIFLTSSLSYDTLILTNDGQAKFRQTRGQMFGSILTDRMFFEDMNGDGRKDLISYAVSGSIYIALNKGIYFETPQQIFNIIPSLHGLLSSEISFSFADFNGDGRKDIVYTYFNSKSNQHELRFLLQQPDGSFADVLPVLPGLPPFTAGIAETATVIDYNQDGLSDLAIQIKDPSSGITLNVYRNLGGSFALISSSLITPSLNSPVYQLEIGDFDQDGRLDMAGVNSEKHVLYFGEMERENS
jgi:hypothetical protein